MTSHEEDDDSLAWRRYLGSRKDSFEADKDGLFFFDTGEQLLWAISHILGYTGKRSAVARHLSRTRPLDD